MIRLKKSNLSAVKLQLDVELFSFLRKHFLTVYLSSWWLLIVDATQKLKTVGCNTLMTGHVSTLCVNKTKKVRPWYKWAYSCFSSKPLVQNSLQKGNSSFTIFNDMIRTFSLWINFEIQWSKELRNFYIPFASLRWWTQRWNVNLSKRFWRFDNWPVMHSEVQQSSERNQQICRLFHPKVFRHVPTPSASRTSLAFYLSNNK